MQGSIHLRLIVALVSCLAFAAVAAMAPVAATAAIKLGVYTAQQGQVGAPEDAGALDGYAAMVGRPPDIVMDYSNITDPLLTPTEVSNLEARGQTPLITWQLFKSGWGGPTIPLSAVAAGLYDSYLRQAADAARNMPFGEILIRFGHEMNGPWYGWSGEPSAYVNAWRHVVTVFRQRNASNVKFVWSPNVDYGSYPFKGFFPGDSWVDYVALDGYNWGTTGQGPGYWQSLHSVFEASYDQLTQLSSKPVMIAEISSSETGGNKAAWILEGFLRTIPNRFPRVSAVIWFDRNQEDDWRIDSSTASLEAYRRVVSSSLYGGGTDPAPASKRIKVLSVDVVPKAIHGKGAKRRRGRVVRRRARVVYRLSRRAAVHIAVRARRARGRRSNNNHLTISRPRRRGSVRISRIMGGRPLRPGAYRVAVRAIDRKRGTRSRPRKARFLIAYPR